MSNPLWKFLAKLCALKVTAKAGGGRGGGGGKSRKLTSTCEGLGTRGDPTFTSFPVEMGLNRLNL